MKKVRIIYIYNIIFNKVKSFIERNQQKRFEIQDNFAKKNKDSELRHDQNVIEVTKENEKLAKESEEKEFQKYIAFYFLKKGQRISLSRKKKEAQTKLQEKAEKLYKAGVIDEYGEIKKSKDDTIDADYLSAVERGDMETAQRMVDEGRFLYCYRPFFMLKYNKRRDAYGETIIGEKGKEG